jgi:DNA-binding NarL/FixJ family response regulator
MKTKSTILTKEERDILILVARHGQHLSNTEIARRLSTSVSRVKTLIHQACLKLGAHNRREAIYNAILKRGEMSLSDLYSLDELAEILSSLGPDMLRRIAHLVRQKLEHGYIPGEDARIISADRRQDSILTQRERDVLILACRGFTNPEIADRLCITSGTVRTYISQASAKLGAGKRGDAVVLAIKQREISVGEFSSLHELVHDLAPLGADCIENIAQLLEQKLGQYQISDGS